MAARNKTSASASASEFLALRSECGGDEQLAPVDDYHTKIHKTEDAAIKEAEKNAEARADNAETGASYVIVKVVKRGSSAGLVWK